MSTTANSGLPAGQYDVALVDGRQCSIKAIETTIDWLVGFLSLRGVLIVWLDPHEPIAKGRLRAVLETHDFQVEAGTILEQGSAVSARRRQQGATSRSHNRAQTMASPHVSLDGKSSMLEQVAERESERATTGSRYGGATTLSAGGM